MKCKCDETIVLDILRKKLKTYQSYLSSDINY